MTHDEYRDAVDILTDVKSALQRASQHGTEFVHKLLKTRSEDKHTQILAVAVGSPATEWVATLLQELLSVYDQHTTQGSDCVLDCAEELFKAKNRDYGDAVETFGITGVLVRLGDKFSRIKTLVNADTEAVEEEKVLDTVMDAINYLIFVQVFISRSMKS